MDVVDIFDVVDGQWFSCNSLLLVNDDDVVDVNFTCKGHRVRLL